MFGRHKDNKIEEIRVTVSTETFFRLAALTVSTIVLLLAARRASHAILLIFVAFFLALALNAPVHWVSKQLPGKRRGNRSLATSISYFIVILLLGGFLASIVPPLVRQTESFVSAAPKLVRDFRSQDSQTGRIIRKYHLEKNVDSVANQLSNRLKHSGGAAFSTAQKVGSSVFALLTIFVLTFMMLVEGPRWLNFANEVIPDRQQSRADRMLADMYEVVRGYVNGQVLLAAIASVLIMPAVLILHISYPIALMVVIFVCGLIPMVGHTLGAIIVTIVALFHSLPAAVIILAYYITYQQLENIFIQPRIQANSTNMSPLLVFIAVVVGLSFGGLIGGLFAIPLAGCIRIVLLEYLREKKIISSVEFREVTTETK